MTDRDNGRRQIYRCECYCNRCTVRSFKDPQEFMSCSVSKPAWFRYTPKKGQRDLIDYFPEEVKE